MNDVFRWLFGRRKQPEEVRDKLKIVGVTLGWDFKPTLCLVGGYVLRRRLEQLVHVQYYQDGDWPTDPVTHEKLPIADK